MDQANELLYLIPLIPLVGAAINLLLGRRLARGTIHAVAVLSVLSSFVICVYLLGPLWKGFIAWRAAGEAAPEVLSGLHQSLYTWIEVGSLKIELAFRLDTLSAVMVLVITFVGTLIHIYSIGYMKDDPRYSTYFGYLNLFMGAMLILVLADNLVVMFIGWEGVGLCSYLLIGFWFSEEANATAGRKAFIVNRIGDVGFLLGICLLFWATGTVSFPELHGEAALEAYQAGFIGNERLAAAAGILLFIGAIGKSAQIPLYVWLPDAMAGPTPVSALIHAATMVTAGVYLIARMSYLYASSTLAMAVVAGVGAATALIAAIMAFSQTDIKKVLAYSTVSQLGFMFAAVGVGAHVAGIFHLTTHAFFKAGLFLAAGSIMHAMSGSGNIMKMGGLKKHLPITHFTFVIFWLAISGFPLLSGFFSKDEILAGTFSADGEGWWPYFGELLWFVLTLAALGTAFYMSRLYYLIFSGECRADEQIQSHIHESPKSMTGPLVVLAGFTLVIGFLGLPHIGSLPNMFGEWLEPSLKSDVVPKLSAGWTMLLLGIATAVALFGIFLGRLYYRGGVSATVTSFTHGFGRGLHDLSLNKFYVDEAYEKYILGPFRWTARMLFEVIDRFLIDVLIVNGVGFVMATSGRIAGWYQNGQIQRYLVGLLVGAALVFYFAQDAPIDFDYEQVNPTADSADLERDWLRPVIKFHGDIGAGPSSVGAVIGWDFNADGRYDSTSLDPTWVFSRPGEYPVTLWVIDGVFGGKSEITKTITVRPRLGGVPVEKVPNE